MTTIDTLIELADAHKQADEYAAGRYEWKGGACAIGCTIHDAIELGVVKKNTPPDSHAAIAKVLEVPELVAYLMDSCFEGVSDDIRPGLTPRFLRAIRERGGLPHVDSRIVARLMTRLVEQAIRTDVRDVSSVIAALYSRRAAGDEPTGGEWDAARSQAYATRRQADAARRQAHAARSQAYAAWSQADAARSQAHAAWRQAYAAWSQAYATRRQADAARRQAHAARSQEYIWIAEMVMEELRR